MPKLHLWYRESLAQRFDSALLDLNIACAGNATPASVNNFRSSLERRIRQLRKNQTPKSEPETPLNQEQFEAMISEE